MCINNFFAWGLTKWFHDTFDEPLYSQWHKSLCSWMSQSAESLQSWYHFKIVFATSVCPFSIALSVVLVVFLTMVSFHLGHGQLEHNNQLWLDINKRLDLLLRSETKRFLVMKLRFILVWLCWEGDQCYHSNCCHLRWAQTCPGQLPPIICHGGYKHKWPLSQPEIWISQQLHISSQKDDMKVFSKSDWI